MENENLNSKLLGLLREKIPQKKRLANMLADLLLIEKESVYRRLREEVPFTLNETELIAKGLSISIDELIGTSLKQYNPIGFKAPEMNISREDANYQVLVNYVNKIGEISSQPYSEHAQALNFLPLGICVPYHHIAKFLVYRFLHLFGDNAFLNPFEAHHLSDRLHEEFIRMEYHLKNITNTFYIWDPSIIPHMVDSIHYFMDIQLIKAKDVEQLKKELFQMLDDLEEFAFNGQFNTGNKFSLFISGIHIGFTHAYLHSEESYMSIFMTFLLQSITLFDKESCMEFKNRIHCLQKLSTMISRVAEKERMDFFRVQREIVETI